MKSNPEDVLKLKEIKQPWGANCSTKKAGRLTVHIRGWAHTRKRVLERQDPGIHAAIQNHIGVKFFMVFLFVFEIILNCSQGWLGIHSVALTGLSLRVILLARFLNSGTIGVSHNIPLYSHFIQSKLVPWQAQMMGTLSYWDCTWTVSLWPFIMLGQFEWNTHLQWASVLDNAHIMF